MSKSPRNYKREYELQKKRGESGTGSDSGKAKRNRARRALEKQGRVRKGDGRDVDHKTPISKGGGNNPKNLRVKDRSANRSFKRTKTGAMRGK